MGTYLSKPIVDKTVVTGEDLECENTPLVYGCVDMQGWRKSMEDAHVANTNIQLAASNLGAGNTDVCSIDNPTSKVGAILNEGRAKMFGVFDGHGGPEVARFCQRHIVDVLVLQPKWQKGDVAGALIDTFHAMDRLIDDPSRKAELYELRSCDAGTDNGNYDALSFRPARDSLKLVQKADPLQVYGVYDSTKLGSPSVAEVSDFENESDDADSEVRKMIHTSTNPEQVESIVVDESVGESSDASVSTLDSQSECEGVSDDSSIDSDLEGEGDNDNNKVHSDKEGTPSHGSESPKGGELSQEEAISLFQKLLNITPDTLNENEAQPDNTQLDKASITEAISESSLTESNSTLATLSSGSLSPNESKTDESVIKARPLISKSDATIRDSMSSDDESSEEEGRKEQTFAGTKIPEGNTQANDEVNVSTQSFASDSSPETPEPFAASRYINGRQVCNLSDHNIQAGCTAIVAILVGRTLTVANAGDSRAVLCRAGGITHPLSFDHKPQQEREMRRILNAGGFVNQFGRVNGNLNLSRSIGDLKYKQIPGITPAEQMITAEPDITSLELEDGDEFVIIGCDGIWDCLSNEDAVQYVRARIDTKRCEEILQEMLDEIISDDPRASQGIGGDNMTCMIIDLLPHTRAYHKRMDSEDEVISSGTDSPVNEDVESSQMQPNETESKQSDELRELV